MKKWKQYYLSDLKRYGDSSVSHTTRKLLKYFRKCQFSEGLLSSINRFIFSRIKKRNSVELFGKTKIGHGLYIGHPYGITINADAIIGNNCNLHKGVLIGQENRGARKGVPTIGNNVWIGVNAAIVGNIKIGDDVLIAPNSYVNKDVPSHSVVFGNPCVIKKKEFATEDYINNVVESI